MEPVRDWRYDALYHGSPERFRLMRETVEWMGEMVGALLATSDYNQTSILLTFKNLNTKRMILTK